MFYVFRVPVTVGGGCLSGKVHSEHIVAAKVLMPKGGRGGWVSRKEHSEHIVATNVLLPAVGMQSLFKLPSCSL